MIGADLEGLVATHEHPDLLATTVLEQLGHADAAFFPFAVLDVEPVQLGLADRTRHGARRQSISTWESASMYSNPSQGVSTSARLHTYT